MAGICMYRCSNRFFKNFSIKLLRSFIHTSNGHIHRALCRLESRGVIRLTGKDTESLLQGLVTNDVYQLQEKSPSAMYTMVLNVQGRVLYDLFLYNVSKDGIDSTVLLVDVDRKVKDELINFLKKYRLRKKVNIEDVSDQFKVWAKWNDVPNTKDIDDQILSFNDPRVPTLAKRILAEQETIESSSNTTEKDYRIHRYKNGIPEGVVDLPPGSCFPLESNLALMNGVNFQKGCYVGQELTARTFHTGVTRKRLMPIYLDSTATITSDTTILTKANGKNAGKFRSCEGHYGLGLLRLEYIREELTVESIDKQVISLKPKVPEWWPETVLTV
ncbi:putative transferase CAF17 homolog, mitochondrial [Biomphalaria glabrata]|uniref:Transferase CAF17 homolog, mitochondrial n=1 Tax=Biomphalaria glabrata TaxID=6526 RepID=A0A9W3AKQ2_BIOGL|nr:putative transferase CAF17 homolog, mitochondrial [Biomphalaria glabrata]XP_055887700.1 putative transferase CAF17 homolog, mitochondrial [Biomphalaria glabrata]